MKYISEIDSIRAFACLMVMWDHLYSRFFLRIGDRELFTGGFIGVDVFFVLSGFLISSLLFQEKERSGRIRYGKFYVRRALRLLPPIFTVVPLVLLPLIYYFDGAAVTILNYFYLVTYTTVLPKFLEVTHRFPNPYWFPHAWSLSIEEAFYLVFPFLVGQIQNLKRFSWSLLFFFFLNACMMPYVLHKYQGGAYHNPFWHFSQIGMGVWLAILVRSRSETNHQTTSGWYRRYTYLFFAALAYVFAMFSFATPGEQTRWFFMGGAPLLTLSILVVLYGVVTGFLVPGVLKSKTLRFIGKISYGLYLFHLPVYRLSERFLERSGMSPPAGSFLWLFVDIANVAIVFLLAILSWFLIERRILNYKERVWASAK
ncbi:MAG TPA: acyltransferase [Leptospiraceae bacterium]|nr:acyltransferase [Leptospiraceae bacterium]HMW60449.1 acyltransferase [Leptospiraceae bacterium]HMX56005.1 acyltransferase [Leptospiraceae bacterium]HMY45959.1 acyltransferase [Leptospiraceae bacterium]HQI19780.1 acyltransferase [Leptospiraceae bacterium]